MARESIAKLIKRYDKAVTNKDQYRSIHQAAYEYTVPSRNLYEDQTPGSPRMNKIYDSTGIKSAAAFVNNMQDSITPPFKKWVNLKLGKRFDIMKDQEPETYKEFAETLELVTDLGFNMINSSNFNSSVVGFYYDLGVGTGIMLTLPNPIDDPIPMKFIVAPIEQVAIEVGADGIVGATFRTSKEPVRTLKDKWPDIKLTQKLNRMIEEDGSQEICVVEASYTVKGTTYYDVFIKEDHTSLVERSFGWNPWIVTRINKSPIDAYGTGPFIQAIPDLRTLNKAKELQMRGAQLSVFGIYTVADNDIVNPNNIVLNPSTFIPVSRNGGPNGPSIAPLPISGNLQAQDFMIKDLQASVRSIMLDDNLPSPSGPVRSATEILERTANIRKTTGVFFGPINQDFVQHLWINIIHVLIDRGTISFPKEFISADFIDIEILSPIAKDQDIEDVQSLVDSWQLAAQMVGPEGAALSFKMEEAIEYIADKRGVPVGLVRTKKERELLQLEIQTAQAAQQQLQQQEEQQ